MGARIGRFEIGEVLGEGGMGVVYEARDPRLERTVALKLIHEPDTRSSLRMLREAQAMARVQHPNVVAIHEVGQHEGQVYIAMERVDGVSLDRLQPPPSDWREIVGLFVQAGRGLAAAHAQGLIHRDIKPHNLLVGRDGRVRVADFGLARLGDGEPSREPGDAPAPPGGDVTASDGDDLTPLAEHQPVGALGASLTRSAALLGTPRYMAPEQHARRGATAASDQFAFCVALWEALFGEHPFVRKADESWSAAVAAGNRLTAPRGKAPGWLVAAVERGLDLDPQRRWPSMTALLRALEPRAARRWVLPVAGAAVMLAGGAAIFALARPSSARPDVCAAAGEGFAAVWTPARRDALTRGFTAAAPYGADTAARVVTRLDAYAAQWSAARVAACRATHGPGATGQPAAVLDRRMQCLDRALADAGRTLDKLAAADAAAVEGALDRVGRLPAVDACGPQLAAVMPDPDDPRAPAIRRDYDVMREAFNRGDTPRAIAMAPDLKRRADELDHPTLRAFIYVNTAMVTIGTIPDEQSVAELQQGHADAIAAGDVGLEARAVALMLNLATRASDRPRIEAILPLAAAAVERPGITDNARGAIYYNHAEGLRILGRFDEALAVCARIETLQDPTDAADCRCNINMQALRLAEAAAACRAAAEINAAEYGPEHPYVYGSLSVLAVVETDRGNHAEALALRERVTAIYARDYAPESQELLVTRENLASSYASLRRYAEARAILEDTLAIRRRAGMGADSRIAYPMVSLAEIEVRAGDQAKGLALMDEAVALFATDSAGTPQHLELIAFRGELNYAARRWATAEESYRRCAEGAPAAFGDGSMMHGACIASRAATLVELGRHRDALPLARQALAILAAVEADPDHVATAHLALGRALAATGDRAGGIAALEAAITEFRKGEPRSDDLPRAETFLAELRR